MKMGDGSYSREVNFHQKEHAEREAVDDGSPKLSRDAWEPQRRFFDARERCPKCIEKFRPKALAFALVPRQGM